jgi:hypothetical protein
MWRRSKSSLVKSFYYFSEHYSLIFSKFLASPSISPGIRNTSGTITADADLLRGYLHCLPAFFFEGEREVERERERERGREGEKERLRHGRGSAKRP